MYLCTFTLIHVLIPFFLFFYSFQSLLVIIYLTKNTKKKILNTPGIQLQTLIYEIIHIFEWNETMGKTFYFVCYFLLLGWRFTTFYYLFFFSVIFFYDELFKLEIFFSVDFYWKIPLKKLFFFFTFICTIGHILMFRKRFQCFN